MAAKKANSAALAADPDNAVPRVALGEFGYSGLRVYAKQILEERQKLFQWPNILKVVDELANDPTISTAFNVYTMMANGVEWCVEPPEDADETEKARAEFVESCMNDMEGSWKEFITEVITYLRYGFQITEKVYRRRLKKNGSKFNDGKIGLRKLSPRSQDTIYRWYYSDDGRDLQAIGQSLWNLEQPQRYQQLTNEDGVLRIDRNKILIFSADSTKGNPQGRSLLKAVFLPYKQMSLLKDQLMLGISKDLQGIPCIGVPPALLDPQATDEKKAAAQQFIDMANNLVKGTQSGIVYPLMNDENGHPTIDIKLLEAKYGKSFDIPKVIEALQTDILTALSVDVVKLGSAGQGSYSLASSKENLLAMAVEYRLKEIRSVLNSDLMRSLYELNGWDTDRMATFEFKDIVSVDWDELGKLVQRTKSVGILPRTHAVVNKVLEAMGVEEIPEDMPLDEKLFPEDMQSRAGDGMKTAGEGTSKKPGGSDSSVSNKENA
jgi:hypothetical protein